MLMVGSITSRKQFAELLVRRNLKGWAVEIGTHRGAFAEPFISIWPGRLICVDPWDTPSGYEDQARYLLAIDGTGNREEDYEEAKRVLGKYGERVLFMRTTSHEAAEQFEEGQLDFVYLDGDHSEESVRQDLTLWWPKLRPGGILAGHDIVCPGPDTYDNWGRSIQPAVWDFSRAQGVHVYLVVETDGMPWSYYMVRPVTPGGDKIEEGTNEDTEEDTNDVV